MPALTPNRSYPYPLPADPTNIAGSPDAPGDIELLAEAIDDDITANLEPVATMPRVLGHMRAGQNQTFQPNIETQVSFQIEYQDTDDMVNVINNPTLMTVNTAGLYAAWALLVIPTDLAWTNIIMRFRVSGVEVYSATQNFQSAGQSSFHWSISSLFPCVVGDTISVTFSTNSPQPFTIGTTREFMAWRMAT